MDRKVGDRRGNGMGKDGEKGFFEKYCCANWKDFFCRFERCCVAVVFVLKRN